MNNAVLVLNQNYEPLNICTVRRALVMVLGGKAEILEQNIVGISTSRDVYPAPTVIRLTYFIRRPRPRVKLTRREILIRDHHTCQYCGYRGNDLTIDHVVPRSRGGMHTWDNVVAACRPCNHRKGGKSLVEARMSLRNQPHEPRVGAYYTIERRLDAQLHRDWEKFLPQLKLPARWSSSSEESSQVPA